MSLASLVTSYLETEADMVGIDARTGKALERPAHIRQSIETILRTPIGTRVMRREFGYEALERDGGPKRGLLASQVDVWTKAALRGWEPRIEVDQVSSVFSDDGALQSVQVRYRDADSDLTDVVTISYR